MLVFRSGDVLFLKGDFSFEKKVLLRLHQIELTSDVRKKIQLLDSILFANSCEQREGY